MGGIGKGVTDTLLTWLEDEDDMKNGDSATFEPDDWSEVGTDRATTPQQVNLREFAQHDCCCLSKACIVAP